MAIDKRRRLAFANHAFMQPCGATEYLTRIIFSDECKMFGFGQKMPLIVQEAPLNSPDAMVWCAIRKNKIVGPCLSKNENVNGNNHKSMPVDFYFPSFNRLKNDYI